MVSDRAKRKNNGDKIIIAMILVIFFLFSILGGLLFVYAKKDNKEKISISSEMNFKNKVYYKISSEFELDEKNGEGKFQIMLNKDNLYYIKAEILDAENNNIGETSCIYPNEEIQEVTFVLKKGVYDKVKDGKIIINAYDSKSLEFRGKSTENIKFNVKKKGK